MPALTLLAAVPELGALLILALIQGISEFLPISSDGHLVLAQHFLRLEGPRLAVDVALHMGTLGAVVVVFWRELEGLARRILTRDLRELGLLFLGSLPAAVVGIGFRSEFEALFDSGRAAASGLLVTAAVLWVGERARVRQAAAGTPAKPLGVVQALLIGGAHAAAILPGVSRSGSTIATALLCGVETQAAARFSFLLSVPAVSGAVLLEVPGLVQSGGFSADLALAVGASFLVGIFALRFLLAFLGKGAFRWCAFYCTAVGTLALFWV